MSLFIESTVANIRGICYTLRSFNTDDVENFRAFMEKSVDDTDFLAVSICDIPNVTNDRCLSMINGMNNDQYGYMIGVFDDNKIVASFELSRASLYRHRCRACIGIVVNKDYWRCGIGSYLLEYVIDKSRLSGISFLELDYCSDNVAAADLYRKFGFVEYGRYPNGWHRSDGTFTDHIYSFLRL